MNNQDTDQRRLARIRARAAGISICTNTTRATNPCHARITADDLDMCPTCRRQMEADAAPARAWLLTGALPATGDPR